MRAHLNGFAYFFSGTCVDGMQKAVRRHCIDEPRIRSRRIRYGRSSVRVFADKSAKLLTLRIWRQPTEILVPSHLAGTDVNRGQRVRASGQNRELFRATGGIHVGKNEGFEQACQSHRLVVGLIGPKKLEILYAAWGNLGRVFLPAAALHVITVCHPFCLAGGLASRDRGPDKSANETENCRS